ncbi:ATP-binding protein [Paraclostridium bifermentans]|uniref:AAA family ATPase n=1 Tax=Paraclostridium bifermentans TaxID=1490 RepID=UPI001C0F99C5|nr:ATP-binding protein [Paraclostridium bifermentans]MBU5288298.1 ATP-binding protein [Paraclostridium bifermentans]
MRIKKVEIKNNIVLGDMSISFMDENMKVKDIIILAGENGCGKTTLLEIIYRFISGECTNGEDTRDEINKITVEFSDYEIERLKESSSLNYLFNNLEGKEVNFIMDYNLKYGRGFKINYKSNNNEIEQNVNIIVDSNMKDIMKVVYSTAEISFRSAPIGTVTSKNLDNDIRSLKQSSELGTEISQLLVDIKALDDADLANWVNENPGKIPPEEIKEMRLKRFKRAFGYIFEGKIFKGIENINGSKEVIFEENGIKTSINQLSSGEKQIVFRGGFLLKDSKKAEGSIILIDEPELSLHPKWQMKILEFFRRIFENTEGKQRSQLFVSTHSPFILHNDSRKNDKVIVLKKNGQGDVVQVDNPSFYSCNAEEIIKEAFEIETFIESVKMPNDKHLIITEGKTDWKHIKKAYEKLLDIREIKELDIRFLEYEDTLCDSKLHQLAESISMLDNEKKVICIFDRDIPKTVKELKNDYKYYKNKVYSMLIPIHEFRGEIPEICIEHLYVDADIKRESNGRRIYIGNEFSQLTGVHIQDKNICCVQKNKCGQGSYKIIDSDSKVVNLNDEKNNIAMSKSDFAENIINEVDEFKEIDFLGFKPLFEKINEIIMLEEK